ncbi:coiled-coil domain-containing protein 96-like [Elysia marginata]|uniref:Coiled-coil domain-containing protein 96-like n=1 Tax=Elysia marginata TaxID=1093978 RepID=A0AAV4IPR6_9GAST|nr:coiled-coil domain-containing protein 96-like [Elysia marginata]
MADAEESASAPTVEEKSEVENPAQADAENEEAPGQSATEETATADSDAAAPVEVKEEEPGEEGQPPVTDEGADENTAEADKTEEPSQLQGSDNVEPGVEAAGSVEQVESTEAPPPGEADGEEAAKPEEGAQEQEGAEQSEEQTKELEENKTETEPKESQEETEEGKQEDGEGAVSKDESNAQLKESAEAEAVKEEGDDMPVSDEVPDQEDEAVAVGERLSRGATPPQDAEQEDEEQDRPEATTPDALEKQAEEEEQGEERDEFAEALPEEDEEEEEMVEDEPDEEEPAFRRQELIERYHDALAERDQLQQQNYGLQHKLAEHFKKKKADERQDYDKNVTDQEQRYLKYMAQLEELRRQDAMEKQSYRAFIEDAKNRCQEKKERVDAERKKFMEFKKQVALNALNSRSGKPIPPKDIEQYMVNEVKKEHDVVNVRLENIKLKNKLKKKEQQLKSKEELAEGLHLIDFEQLKIENQTYNEKIEERNEELLKLRKKITSTVQVLTHLKEKLQFVQGENLEQTNELKEVESELAQSRDILSRTKQARDALRIDNQKLRQNCGLLGSEPLLRDFEERKDESDDLLAKLETLKMRHAELTLHCNQVRRKIDQARLQAA